MNRFVVGHELVGDGQSVVGTMGLYVINQYGVNFPNMFQVPVRYVVVSYPYQQVQVKLLYVVILLERANKEH